MSKYDISYDAPTDCYILRKHLAAAYLGTTRRILRYQMRKLFATLVFLWATLLLVYGLAYEGRKEMGAEQINGKPYFGQTDTEMMNKLSTPLEYIAWVLANRYWLIGAGFYGFSNDLRGGHYANCEDEPRRMFKNYFQEKKWDFDEWAHKKKPKGLDKWLEKEGLGGVLVEPCYPRYSNSNSRPTAEGDSGFVESNRHLYEMVVMGEAANQGSVGLLAVAEVLKRRRWDCGAFSASGRRDLADFYARQPEKIKHTASEVIEKVRLGGVDTTGGATAYLTKALYNSPKCPGWARRMKIAVVIRDHVFLKQKGEKSENHRSDEKDRG